MLPLGRPPPGQTVTQPREATSLFHLGWLAPFIFLSLPTCQFLLLWFTVLSPGAAPSEARGWRFPSPRWVPALVFSVC